MCGRYTNTSGPEELNDRFRVPIPSAEGTRRYNIAPTEEVLTIVRPKGEPQAGCCAGASCPRGRRT